MTATITGSTLVDNDDDGLEINVFNDAGDSVITVSGSSLYDNTDVDLENNGDDVNAAGNWWYTATPFADGLIGGGNAAGVTWNPPLGSAP